MLTEGEGRRIGKVGGYPVVEHPEAHGDLMAFQYRQEQFLTLRPVARVSICLSRSPWDRLYEKRSVLFFTYTDGKYPLQLSFSTTQLLNIISER